MPADTKPPFRFWSFFFSPQGRVSQKAIWFFVLPIKLCLLAGVLYQRFMPRPDVAISELFTTTYYLLTLVIGITTFLTLWWLFALLVKRLHDIGWSGWPALPIFYPLIYGVSTTVFIMSAHAAMPPMPLPLPYVAIGLSYWPLVLALLLALIPGKRGANRYGQSPTGEMSDVAQHF